MIEILNILGDGRLEAHTAIILTYGLDLTLYDGLVRRCLRSAGIKNQIVFCDANSYKTQLEAITSGAARFLGSHYSVTPVRDPGAFHPKMYLLLGRRHGRLIVGSGNATAGGLLRNAELFGVFKYSSDAPTVHSAFKAALSLVGMLAKVALGVVQAQIARASELSPWLKLPQEEDGRRLLVGGPGRAPLMDQLLAAAEGEVESATVISSSFDRKLEGLARLARVCPLGALTCVVQPETVKLDGEAVRRLGKGVQWRAFVDPVQQKGKSPGASSLHAKFYLLQADKWEVAAFGSANASRPALLGGARNSELLVLLPRQERGFYEQHLSLKPTLSGPSLRAILEEHEWDDSDPPGASEPCFLSGVALEGGELKVTLAKGDMPDGAHLGLFAKVDSQPSASLQLVPEPPAWKAALPVSLEAVRLAGVLDGHGKLVSNLVGIMSAAVARQSAGTGIEKKQEAALAAMEDGEVLDTVLFELLSNMRDFQVMGGGGGKKKKEEEPEPPPGHPKEVASFYTDEVPDKPGTGIGPGDRTDLDLLAALIQPLEVVVQEDRRLDDTAALDSDMNEEEQLKDKESGQDKVEEPRPTAALPTFEALMRSRKKLTKRLKQAATSLDRTVGQLDALETVPVASLARQLWMVQVAAFLTGRSTRARSGEEVLCLDPTSFAKFVLALARALAGGRKGGLLVRIRAEAWEGLDGDSLRRGLGFLWTCVIWATAQLDTYWKNGSEEENAIGPWDGVPELIAARFIHQVKARCEGADRKGLHRRLPTWEDLSGDGWGHWTQRLNHIAGIIQQYESGDAGDIGSAQDMLGISEGDLVYSPYLGITMVKEILPSMQGEICHLIDLTGKVRRKEHETKSGKKKMVWKHTDSVRYNRNVFPVKTKGLPGGLPLLMVDWNPDDRK